MPALVVIRGGGDLASGTALRLFRAGLKPIITELPQPLAVRRSVSFAEAVFSGSVSIENVTGRKASDLVEAFQILASHEIPILIDPHVQILHQLVAINTGVVKIILVDARMLKTIAAARPVADLVIGLGPGFVPGLNCDVVIETMRGHYLGRALWQAAAQSDTGIPESVAGRSKGRVIRAPSAGEMVALAEIGDLLEKNQAVAMVAGQVLRAPFRGVLRGLLHPGVTVAKGTKIGDVDPRGDPRFCQVVSDKSLAVGGGVLEAICSRGDLRPFLWE